MNWISTNIRFPEDQYRKLKIKAARERVSLAKVVREATTKMMETSQEAIGGIQEEKKQKAKKLISEMRKIAKANTKYVPKGFKWVEAIREMRYIDK